MLETLRRFQSPLDKIPHTVNFAAEPDPAPIACDADMNKRVNVFNLEEGWPTPA